MNNKNEKIAEEERIFHFLNKNLLAAGVLALLAACGPEAPIRIGLLAGLSDRGSDFGESVRNGVILAV